MSEEAPAGLELPWRELERDTLVRLLEEYVTRESTDSGLEVSLDQRVREVLVALEKRRAVLLFDPATQSCTVVSR